jgi:hypothetical protein
LTFPDHMHEFDAGDKDAGAAKILEAEHRSGSTFDATWSCSTMLFRYLIWLGAGDSTDTRYTSEHPAELHPECLHTRDSSVPSRIIIDHSGT